MDYFYVNKYLQRKYYKHHGLYNMLLTTTGNNCVYQIDLKFDL